MIRIFLVIILFVGALSIQAKEKTDQNIEKTAEIENKETLLTLKSEVALIDEELLRNIWITRYNNYLTYRKLEKELAKIKADAKKYERWKGEKYKELSYQLFNKIKIKENELELISEYKDSPIGKQISPAPIDNVPEVTNPIAIIEAMSFVQQLNENVENYKQVKSELQKVLEKLQTKKNLLQEI